MLGALSIVAGLVVGFWVVKGLFGRNGLFGGQKEEQPADVASFDFYVETDTTDPAGTVRAPGRIETQQAQ